MGKFVIKTSEKGASFNLKASNGQVVASSQQYASLATCKKGIESVKKNAPIAPIEDQTVEEFEVQKNPKFEVYTDKAGKTRFRLKAANGQIIAVGQAYKSKDSCLKGIESIKKNAPESETEIAPAEE